MNVKIGDELFLSNREGSLILRATPLIKDRTNADRIRGMSDEEHARFLVRVVSDGCPPDMDWDCQKDSDGWDACDKCWERWLRQPAEET